MLSEWRLGGRTCIVAQALDVQRKTVKSLKGCVGLEDYLLSNFFVGSCRGSFSWKMMFLSGEVFFSFQKNFFNSVLHFFLLVVWQMILFAFSCSVPELNRFTKTLLPMLLGFSAC